MHSGNNNIFIKGNTRQIPLYSAWSRTQKLNISLQSQNTNEGNTHNICLDNIIYAFKSQKYIKLDMSQRKIMK